MSRNSMPVLIPGVLYQWVSKPNFNTNTGERIPDGYTTILAKFVRTDGSDYFWIMRQFKFDDVKIENDVINTTEISVPKEALSKGFFVSEADRTGGKRKRKRKDIYQKEKIKKQGDINNYYLVKLHII